MAARTDFSINRPPEPVAEAGGAFDPAAVSIDLSALLALLRRQFLLILLTTALFLGAGFAYSSFADKVYQATTRVLLDPGDKQPGGPEIVQSTQGGDLSWIETQVDLITASGTLRNVADSENLIDDPEFGGTGSPADLDAVLISLARHVRAERAGQPYAIDIIVSSTSAEKAARLSTAVSNAFMTGLTEAQQNTARQASVLITRQIDDLKAKVREAEERVEAYRKENGGIQVDSRAFEEPTLKQLNEADVAARLKADEASGRLARIDAIARASGGDLASALSTVDSPVLDRLKVEYGQALRQQAELQQTLGGRHPLMQAIDADIASSRSLITQELNTLVARARVDADLAKAQVASSTAALAAATRKVSDTSDASVALRDLEGEASIRRDVYRAFVARAQEAGPQRNPPVSDARIISPAQPPLHPSSPRERIILGVAGLGGLGVGVALALYRGRARLLRQTVKPSVRLVNASPSPSSHGESTVSAPALNAPSNDLSASDILVEVAMPGSLASGTVLTEEAARELIGGVATDAHAAFQSLAEVLTNPGDTEGPAVHVLFGTVASGAIAAVAYGLACAMAEFSVETLLIDANNGTVTTGGSLIGRDASGILDVEFDDADPHAVGTRLSDASIVLLPAASARLRHEIGGYGDRLVETIRDVADGFERVVVDLGPSCPPALFKALVAIADDVVMVVDAQEAGSPEIRAMFDELRHLVPDLRGIVTTRATSVVIELPPSVAMG